MNQILKVKDWLIKKQQAKFNDALKKVLDKVSKRYSDKKKYRNK